MTPPGATGTARGPIDALINNAAGHRGVTRTSMWRGRMLNREGRFNVINRC